MTKKLLPALSLCTSLFFTSGFVKPIIVNIEDLPKSEKWSIQEPEDQRKALRLSSDPATKAGISEALQDYSSCVLFARKVSPKSPIKDWIGLLELTCAIQVADITSPKNSWPLLAETLKRVENSPPTTQNKVLLEKRRGAILSARLVLCRNLKKKARWKELRSELQKAFAVEGDYSKVERAELYDLAGEVLVAERQWTEAFNQFERSREIDPEGAQTEIRIRAILPMLAPQVRDQFENRLKAANPLVIPVVNPSTDEQEIVSQAESFLTRNDPVSAVEAMSKLIHRFPAGIRAKWAQDKIFELLSQEVEKSKGPSGPSVIKKKILSAMNDFDSDRQVEWGKSLFDMQLYGDAAPLLKRAAEQNSSSAKASKSFFMAGRAFQLSNDYSHAKDMYQIVLKNYPASQEVVDAAIQWGLVNVNENDPSEAITHLEVARSHRLTSQQDLVSLFWLYESYKMKKADAGAANAASDLMKRFGLTYYGIIAFQDSNRALPQYEKIKEKPAKIFLSQQETEAVERARLLLKAGLFNAASDELSVFANRPLNQEEQEFLLGFYSQSVHHQKSFALLSGMFDEMPEKKTDSLVRKLFPKEFWELVTNDKLKADLDPFLILSVMKQESAFDHRAVSHSGALGLLQMIPPTAQEVKQELHSELEMPSGLNDPATNVKYCAYYLAKLIKKYNGSIPLALAAYNAGPTRVTQFINAKGGVVRDTWVDELPWAETSFYVKSILKNYLMYRILYGGLTQLPVPPWAAVVPAATPAPSATP